MWPVALISLIEQVNENIKAFALYHSFYPISNQHCPIENAAEKTG